jgi:nucleoside-diphosphate-sugar epimerase
VRATTGNGYESPDAKRVLVIEGDSRIGVQIVKTFQDPSNHWKVTALVSGRDEKKQKYARALEALQVNLCEQSYDSVMKTAPYDVVISCITTGKADVEPVYARNQVFVDAAVELGVSKYVFLSSVGAGSSEVALPGPAKETMKPFMTDKHRAEQYLESASMDHLVVRCAPLNDILEDTALGKPMLTEAPEAYGWVTAAGKHASASASP